MGVALTFLITNGVDYVVTDAEIERVAKLCADCKNTGYTEKHLKQWFENIAAAYWEAYQDVRVEVIDAMEEHDTADDSED